jgi:YVTN family beta-propeller protein
MSLKFNQFIVFATSIIILILISLFSHNVYYYITGQKPIIVDDTTYLEDTPGIAYNRHKASEQGHLDHSEDSGKGDTTGQHQEKDQGKNKSKEVKTEYTEEKKKSWLSMLYIPSFITTMSSRNVPVTTYKAGANFTSNKPITTLTSTSYEKISSTPSITKTLPNLTYLGTVRTLENINIGDNKIILDNSKIALINGMQLIIDNKNYTITDVSIVTSWFIKAIQVVLDTPCTSYIPSNTYLKVLSSNTSLTTTNSSSSTITSYGPSSSTITSYGPSSSTITSYGPSSSTITSYGPSSSSITSYGPSSSIITTKIPSPKAFILHLSKATVTNGKLSFNASVNITTDTLKQISKDIVTTDEPFEIKNREGFIEGYSSYIVNTTTVPVGTTPYSIAYDGNYVWVGNFGNNTVSRIDISQFNTNTNTSTSTSRPSIIINIGTATSNTPFGIAVDSTYLWVANNSISGTVSQFDKSTQKLINTIPVGNSPYGILSDGPYVWVTNYNDGTVSRIDKSKYSATTPSGTTTTTLSKPITYTVGSNPCNITSDSNYIYVANNGDNTVSRIDKGISSSTTPSGTITTPSSTTPSSTTPSRPITIAVGKKPFGIVTDNDYVWVTNSDDNNVSRILKSQFSTYTSPSKPPTIPVGNKPLGITMTDDNYVWVVNNGDNTVTRIDKSQSSTTPSSTTPSSTTPSSTTPSGTTTPSRPVTYNVGNSPWHITTDGTNLWVSNSTSNTVTQIYPIIPTMTPTMTPTVTPTMTPTDTPTMTPTDTPTMTPTITQTMTPTITQTMTPTITQTMTPTITQTMTPTITQTMTPTPTKTISNQIICTTKSSTTDTPSNSNNSSLNLSTFYVSDCVGYPIKEVLFKNDTLTLQLDTNDDSMLYSGYYKLVL